jgi:predicted amidohydrolase
MLAPSGANSPASRILQVSECRMLPEGSSALKGPTVSSSNISALAYTSTLQPKSGYFPPPVRTASRRSSPRDDRPSRLGWPSRPWHRGYICLKNHEVGAAMKLRVVGAQIPVMDDVNSNLKAINDAVDYAIDEGADILLTPEGSLSGYTHRFSQKAVCAALRAIISRTKGRLGLALATCYIEEDGRCYDQIRFYDRDGRYLGFHSKVLLCSNLNKPLKGEIKRYHKRPLRTFTFKGLCIGGLICNDMWANPFCTYMPDTHLSQQLARMGARVIFHAVNGGRDKTKFSQEVTRNFHESNLKMRAKAGKLWIITVDNCSPPDIPCSSPGGIVTPEGEWAVRLPPKGEHLCAHTIDIS